MARQNIYRYGDTVLIGPEGSKVEATVLGVELRGYGYQQVTYLVSWWEDKTCKTEWLHAIQVEGKDDDGHRAHVVYETGGL